MRDIRDSFFKLVEYAPSVIQKRLVDLLESVAFLDDVVKTETPKVEVEQPKPESDIPESMPMGGFLIGFGVPKLSTPFELFWDFVSARLGIGTQGPARKLHINGADPQMRLSYPGTGYIEFGATTGGDLNILPSGDEVVIGAGAAGVDYTLTFNGETNDGSVVWMEDEDYFKFLDDILMDSDGKIYFRDTAIYLFSQADGYLNLVADSGVRVGDATPTNYTQFDSTGHQIMVGTAKPWTDLRVEPVARTTGANAPTFEKWYDDAPGTSRGVYLYSFDDAVVASEKEIFFTMQMPHEWDQSTIHIHVHWVPAVAQVAATPRWGLEYNFKSPGEVFGDTAIIYAVGNIQLDADLTANKHYITEFADITPDGTQDDLSSILIGRIFRNSSDAADTYNAVGAKCGLLYIDAHFQLNSLGSNEEYVK